MAAADLSGPGRDVRHSSRQPAVGNKREIVMLTGSHHYQAFWTQHGSELHQVPVIYHLEQQRWIPKEDSFLQDRRESYRYDSTAIWNENCIQCHSVAGAPNYVGDEARSHVVELGIACESCHGPGATHVALHRNQNGHAVSGTGEVDDGVVNPARLSHQRSAQICGQCHSYFLPKNNRDWWVHGYSRSYHAGDDLLESRTVILPEKNDDDPKVREVVDRLEDMHNLYWPDGSAVVGGREFLGLLQSPCYQHGEMSCVSCHSMHGYKDASDQLAEDRNGNHACLQCHHSFDNDTELQRHTHHAVGSSGSECYNCHMPHTSYALFKGIRNHRITSPRVEPKLESHRPNACNLCHLDQTRQWTAERLTAWYGQPPVDVESDCREIADGVLLILKGNALQRAIATWAMGSKDAQTASGTDWMAPFLADRLTDVYSPVRMMASRTIRTLPAYDDWQYDFLAAREEHGRQKRRLLNGWTERSSATSGPPAERLLMAPDGSLMSDVYERLIRQRDDRKFSVSE